MVTGQGRCGGKVQNFSVALADASVEMSSINGWKICLRDAGVKHPGKGEQRFIIKERLPNASSAWPVSSSLPLTSSALIFNIV